MLSISRNEATAPEVREQEQLREAHYREPTNNSIYTEMIMMGEEMRKISLLGRISIRAAQLRQSQSQSQSHIL